MIEPQKGRIIVDVSSGQAYLLGRVVLFTFISLHDHSAIISNQVALLLKWKKCSWMVMVRLIDRLGIGHILQFDSSLLLSRPRICYRERFVPEAISVLPYYGDNLPSVLPFYLVCLIKSKRIHALVIAFPLKEKWKNLNLDVSGVAPSACMQDDKKTLYRPERATDLLGIIHTNVYGPLRHVSRKDAS
ncbi:hypothetical protein Tco_0241047 [Tanacetum coccineum]